MTRAVDSKSEGRDATRNKKCFIYKVASRVKPKRKWTRRSRKRQINGRRVMMRTYREEEKPTLVQFLVQFPGRLGDMLHREMEERK